MEIPFIESQILATRSFHHSQASKSIGEKMADKTNKQTNKTINTFWKATGGWLGGGNLMLPWRARIAIKVREPFWMAIQTGKKNSQAKVNTKKKKTAVPANKGKKDGHKHRCSIHINVGVWQLF